MIRILKHARGIIQAFTSEFEKKMEDKVSGVQGTLDQFIADQKM